MASVNESEMTIEALNAIDNDKYVLTLVALLVIIAFGMIGNGFVIYIYKTKFKRSSARVYIISLALADLSVCVIGVPYHVLDLTFSANFPSRVTCQLLSFLIGSCTLSSIFILLVVGLDRFRKVCRPLKKQIADFGDRKACVIVTIIAVLLNIPNGVMYGNSSVKIADHNITGVECFIDDEYAGTAFATGFLGLNLLIFIVSCVYLIVIYAFIGKKIYQQAKLGNGMSLDEIQTFCLCCTRKQQQDESDEEEEAEGEDNEGVVKFANDASEEKVTITVPDILVEDYNVKEEAGKSGEHDVKAVKNNTLVDKLKSIKLKGKSKKDKPKTLGESRRSQKTIHKISSSTIIRHTNPDRAKKEKNTRKITLMMMTITIVFIVTYLPFIAMSIIDSLIEDFWEDLYTHESVLYDLLLRLYLLNNVANPLIYGFWDDRFRREVIRLIRKLVCCGSNAPSKTDGSNSSSGSSNVTTKRTLHDTVKFQ